MNSLSTNNINYFLHRQRLRRIITSGSMNASSSPRSRPSNFRTSSTFRALMRGARATLLPQALATDTCASGASSLRRRRTTRMKMKRKGSAGRGGVRVWLVILRSTGKMFCRVSALDRFDIFFSRRPAVGRVEWNVTGCASPFLVVWRSN